MLFPLPHDSKLPENCKKSFWGNLPFKIYIRVKTHKLKKIFIIS